MITIYGAEWCAWCKKAKELAEDRQLRYEWKDVEDPDVYDEMKSRIPSAKTSIPQIFWDKRHVGGYTDFAIEVENTIGGYGDGRL